MAGLEVGLGHLGRKCGHGKSERTILRVLRGPPGGKLPSPEREQHFQVSTRVINVIGGDASVATGGSEPEKFLAKAKSDR